ncbi:unnamed protein product, partial [Symbiodinium microadriaticum]
FLRGRDFDRSLATAEVYTTNADDPLNNVYDTGMMDRVSMDVLFFGFHQAAVRFMAVDPNDPNLGVILGVLQGSPDDPATSGLCQLTPGCTYGDAREAIRLYEQVLAGPPSGWGVINDMRYSVPEYRIAAVAMTLTLGLDFTRLCWMLVIR